MAGRSAPGRFRLAGAFLRCVRHGVVHPRVLEGLEAEDPDLVEQIRRLMFVFEDIKMVNDKGIQLDGHFWISDPENGQNNVASDIYDAVLGAFRKHGIALVAQ